MKNKFSILIINEKTQSNMSFKLSLLWVRIVLGALSVFLIFFLYLGIKVYIQLPQEKQIAINHNTQQNLMQMVFDLNERGMIEDSLLKKYNLLDQYNHYAGILPISIPVHGIVTQGISQSKKNPHYGLDIAAPYKSEIHAVQEGLVIVSDVIETLGNTIIIAHPNNYYSVYAHMYKGKVKKRTYVKNDQLIGYVGNSENGEGPHLHFEIWNNNVIIDPRNLIKEYKTNDVSIR